MFDTLINASVASNATMTPANIEPVPKFAKGNTPDTSTAAFAAFGVTLTVFGIIAIKQAIEIIDAANGFSKSRLRAKQ